jgi:hypothetical protein
MRLWLGERRLRAKKATSAYRLGANQKLGDLSQVLGTFGVLTDYDEVLLLSSTSAQSSLDLMGIKGNRLDLIEFKKEGTALTKGERRLKQLATTGQLEVSYRVVDVKLPDGASVVDRAI